MQKIKIAWLKYICIYFIVLCGPGTYSSSGQIPCKKCPRGKYQTDYGRTRCEDCGVGLSTIQDGAMSFRDCSTKGWHLFFEINSNAFGMMVLFFLILPGTFFFQLLVLRGISLMFWNTSACLAQLGRINRPLVSTFVTHAQSVHPQILWGLQISPIVKVRYIIRDAFFSFA